MFKGSIEFGIADFEFGKVWPSESELLALDVSEDWRITQINYKRNRNQFSLSYIEFVFNNGYTAPACMAERARDEDELV